MQADRASGGPDAGDTVAAELVRRGESSKVEKVVIVRVDTSLLTKIGAIESWSHLAEVSVIGHGLSDASGFAVLRDLRCLDVSQNRFTELSSFCVLVKLERLNVSRNQVKQIPPAFDQLKRLKVLKLEGNCIDDRKCFLRLQGNGGLTSLDMRDNPVLQEEDAEEYAIRCLPQLTVFNSSYVEWGGGDGRTAMLAEDEADEAGEGESAPVRDVAGMLGAHSKEVERFVVAERGRAARHVKGLRDALEQAVEELEVANKLREAELLRSESLRQKVGEVTAELRQLAREKGALGSEVVALRQELDDLMRQQSEARSARQTAAEGRLRDASARFEIELADARLELDEVAGRLGESQRARRKLEAELVEARAGSLELREARAECDELERVLRASKDEARVERERFVGHLAKLRDDLTRAEAAREAACEVASTSRAALASCRARIEKLREDVREAQREAGEYEQALAEVRVRASVAEDQRDVVRRERDALAAQLRECRDAQSDAMREVEELRARCSAEVRAVREDAASKARAAQAKVKREAEEAVTELESDRERVAAELARARAAVERERAHRSRAMADLQAARKAREGEAASYKKAMAAQEERLSELEDELADAWRERERLAAELAATAAAVVRGESEVAARKGRAASPKRGAGGPEDAELVEAKERAEKAEQELETLRGQAATWARDLEDAEAREAALRRALAEAKGGPDAEGALQQIRARLEAVDEQWSGLEPESVVADVEALIVRTRKAESAEFAQREENRNLREAVADAGAQAAMIPQLHDQIQLLIGQRDELRRELARTHDELREIGRSRV